MWVESPRPRTTGQGATREVLARGSQREEDNQMPMFVEVCANCGCNEFAHHWDEETDSPYWECGRCSEATWIEEPDAMLCICGCTEEAHYPGRRCQECDDCDRFEEHETALEAVRERVGYYTPNASGASDGTEDRGAAWVDEETVKVDWLDQPVTIEATMVRDEDDQLRRVNRLPEDGEDVFVYLGTTEDGLPVAIHGDEIRS